MCRSCNLCLFVPCDASGRGSKDHRVRRECILRVVEGASASDSGGGGGGASAVAAVADAWAGSIMTAARRRAPGMHFCCDEPVTMAVRGTYGGYGCARVGTGHAAATAHHHQSSGREREGAAGAQHVCPRRVCGLCALFGIWYLVFVR